jgi:hypothetical protein
MPIRYWPIFGVPNCTVKGLIARLKDWMSATKDKTVSTRSGCPTEPGRRSRRAAAVIVAMTTIALGGTILWYRTHSRAIADDTVAPTRRNSSLTLAPETFAGEAREAYEVARDDPDLLTRLHCYCGCDKVLGHRNLLDCYRDRHAATCATCIGETIDARHMSMQGSPVEQIRDALRARYEHAE